MTNFNKESTTLSKLKDGDLFITNSNNVGIYLGKVEGGYKIKNNSTDKEYVVPHGNFPVFKEKPRHNNNFKKKDYLIKRIDKSQAYEFIKKYHYLADAKFFAKFSFGLFKKGDEEILGVTTFSNPQGNVALKGWFGLPNTDQTVLELSRLCVLPNLNGTNATSFLLGTSIRLLKKENVRAVITLADNSRHSGSIYQVCNFTYYGLSTPKSDFFLYIGDGTFKKNYRGTTKEAKGVWLPRTQKHRYAYIMDKTLVCNYTPQESPNKEDFEIKECVCENEVVFDKRFEEKFTCPNCTKKLILIN